MAKKAEYGKGHSAFLEYTKFIAEHPTYAGMPDLYADDGTIQWEAPSNRIAGKFKDTHHRRRDWWRKKAVEVGIDPESPHWISRTAKLIHPTNHKPCKKCGRSMDIRYAYPKARLLARILTLPYIDESFPLDPLEHLTSLITRLVEQNGNIVFADLPKLLTTSEISPPATLEPSLESWLLWIDEKYIPQEPTTCSPGVMSNAPDRFDGFHSFNLCCRSKADLGRSKANLQSYTTDRRVFEYWVEGDWLVADRIMGLVRSSLSQENCFNGHPGPCAADHIGPISLGFIHRPEFRLLCRTCNSAKNNRMTLSDVEHLRTVNAAGEIVTSWYATRLWNLRKNAVVSEETALRLSKLMRDNRHTVMFMLNTFAEAGYYSFLASFCGLEYANFDITFENFRAVNSLTCFDRLIKAPRTTKYTAEQMSLVPEGYIFHQSIEASFPN